MDDAPKTMEWVSADKVGQGPEYIIKYTRDDIVQEQLRAERERCIEECYAIVNDYDDMRIPLERIRNLGRISKA